MERKNENDGLIIEQTNNGDHGINVGGNINNIFYFLCHCRFKKTHEGNNIASANTGPLSDRRLFIKKVSMLALLSVCFIVHFLAPSWSDWNVFVVAICYLPAGAYALGALLIITNWQELDGYIQQNFIKLQRRQSNLKEEQWTTR